MSEQGPTRYGFAWGPMEVRPIAHIEGRGRVLEIQTRHARLQVYVSEKGRRIRAFDLKTGRELV